MYKLCLVFLVAILSSCSTTEQVKKLPAQSGFLQDYSMLKKGNDQQAGMIYIKPDAEWKKYKKIIIEPITVWADEDSDLRKLKPKELQDTLSLLHASIRHSVKDDLVMTDTPGPDTLTLKVALTQGEKSSPIGDTLSSVIPIGMAVTLIKRITLGTHLSVGKASIEAELIDSTSGERLIAAMDSRAGTKAFKGKFDSWNDVKSAFEYWSQKFNNRILELKGIKIEEK